MNNTTWPNLMDNPDNIKYEYRHNSSVLYMRDRALNREKQLWAKVQYSEITFKFVGTITVLGYKNENDASPKKTVTINIPIDSTDSFKDPINILNSYSEELDKFDNYTSFEWKVSYPFFNTALTVFGSSSGYKKIIIQMDTLLANYLGFKETQLEYKYKSGFETQTIYSDYPAIDPNETIYMYHPNFLGSNYNDDEISVMFHPHERQINYDLIYEVRSLNPTVRIDFFQYCLQLLSYKDNDGNAVNKTITVRRKVFPTNFNVIMGLYDGF